MDCGDQWVLERVRVLLEKNYEFTLSTIDSAYCKERYKQRTERQKGKIILIRTYPLVDFNFGCVGSHNIDTRQQLWPSHDMLAGQFWPAHRVEDT